MAPTKPPLLFNGWRVLFTQPFTARYGDLRGQVRRLKEELGDTPRFHAHPTTRLFNAIHRAVFQLVPADPDRKDFRLEGDLARFRRVKKAGLPARYRLFYIFSSEARAIIFLYLNDEETLRKEGSGSDPYVVFTRLLGRGEIGRDFEKNYQRWAAEHERQ